MKYWTVLIHEKKMKALYHLLSKFTGSLENDMGLSEEEGIELSFLFDDIADLFESEQIEWKDKKGEKK